MKGISFLEPAPLIGILEKQNMKKLCDYHRDRGHNTNDCYRLKKHIEEVVASCKLAHLVRDIYRSNQKSGNQKRNDVKVLMGRTEMKSLGAVVSTIHSMIKFPTDQGVITMETIMENLWECMLLEKMLGSWDETQWLQHMEQMLRILEQSLLRTRNYLG
ncbi:hypothetical protein Tco_1012211 [Tanacetum coccineum]